MTLSDNRTSIRLKRIGFISAIVFAGILLSYFLFRNFLLHNAFDRIAKKLKERKQIEVALKELHFTGFTGVVMKNLVVVSAPGDTLMAVDSVYVNPSFFWMLIGKIRLNEAALDKACLFLTCKNDHCNFDFLKRGRQVEISGKAERDYSALVNRLVTEIFNYTPQQANFQNILIQYTKDDFTEQLAIPEFSSSKDEIHGSFLKLSDSTHWNLSGKFSQQSRTFDVKIYPDNKKRSQFPFTQSLFNVTCIFDTLHGVLAEYKTTGHGVYMNGSISATELFIRHRKISDDPVVIRQVDFNFRALIGNKSIEMDSASAFLLNKILIHPYLLVSDDRSKKYKLKIDLDKIQASDFFHSLPPGIFDAVDGIVADGNLDYHLNFFLDSSQPDSLIFVSSMRKENFHLKKFGDLNLAKLNEEFLYDAYDGDRYVRSFAIGPSNPEFTPLEQVSAYLKNAIMTSEDGSFFFHNGFNEDAFRKSIAANYKAGKFVRGGSTITMQLVKNVFLNRHKTIARKVEEAMIVWLIESNRICSKERMLEVYLNIIELGPGIYGVGEASRFYFNKRPAELDLAESVFIASLLPRPKWFKYSFDEQGDLKPYFADYYRVVANFLLRKNLITQTEYDQLRPHVELKGPARNFITPVDSLPPVEEDSESNVD